MMSRIVIVIKIFYLTSEGFFRGSSSIEQKFLDINHKVFLLGWYTVQSVRRPLFDLLYHHQVIKVMMYVEKSAEWELAKETEVLGENLPQCHIVYHKYHMSLYWL
jgi:hypothetical protein